MINNKKARLEAIEKRAEQISINREINLKTTYILVLKALINLNQLEVNFI